MTDEKIEQEAEKRFPLYKHPLQHIAFKEGIAFALSIVGNSCPFCGSEPTTTDVGGTWSTICSNSDCNVCPEAEGVTKEESINAWNKRA